LSEPSIPSELVEYRKQIDICDQDLIAVLVRRFEIVRKVGEFKAEKNMDAVQPARAQAVKDRAVLWGREQGLDPVFIRGVYEVLIDYAHDLEHEILDEADHDKAGHDKAGQK